LGSLIGGVNPLLNGGLAIKNQHRAAESGGLSVGWRRPGLASVAQP
jgi:hypothetical protein